MGICKALFPPVMKSNRIWHRNSLCPTSLPAAAPNEGQRMKIETYIDALTSYAIKTGLADTEDRHVLINRLLDLLGKADYESSGELQPKTLEVLAPGEIDHSRPGENNQFQSDKNSQRPRLAC